MQILSQDHSKGLLLSMQHRRLLACGVMRLTVSACMPDAHSDILLTLSYVVLSRCTT